MTGVTVTGVTVTDVTVTGVTVTGRYGDWCYGDWCYVNWRYGDRALRTDTDLTPAMDPPSLRKGNKWELIKPSPRRCNDLHVNHQVGQRWAPGQVAVLVPEWDVMVVL